MNDNRSNNPSEEAVREREEDVQLKVLWVYGVTACILPTLLSPRDDNRLHFEKFPQADHPRSYPSCHCRLNSVFPYITSWEAEAEGAIASVIFLLPTSASHSYRVSVFDRPYCTS